MNIKDYLNQYVKIIVDRPLGSKHPKFDFIYSLNYGYIPGTISGDGQEIDAYIIGEFESLFEFEGYVIAIIYRKNDNEEKLVVCKEKDKYTKEQIYALVEFVERFFDSYIEM
ncbi:MAG: inorganic pyrophosphatase family protein [Haloplasmataceae bacterium]|jgi:inorganic pyrophosphatase|nr:inorganic pyrophosphatase family protein [Haloplasmataceae bacterium]